MSFSPSRIRQFAAQPALWCAVAVGVCLLAAGPSLEMGFNDDFSYIYTAKMMASTGHIVYNGWATAMLGWQIYLGALFIKLFGFSFTAVRASIWLVGMATAALMQRLFVRLGLNEWNATLAALTIALSPLLLPLTFSFMTDASGFLAYLLCVYGCVRAVQAGSDKTAIGWLIFAAASNSVGGTARQIAWLGALVLVPSTAWVIRRRRGALAAGAILWIASTVFIFGVMQWFKRQPYSISEDLISGFHPASRKYVAILLFAFPVLISFLARYPIRKRWARIWGGAAIAALILAGCGAAALWHRGFSRVAPFLLAPFSDEWITAKGLDITVLPGHRPDVLSMPFRLALTLLILLAFFALLVCALNVSRLEKPPSAVNEEQISNQTLLILLGPVTAAYLLVLMTHGTFFERYFLQLLFPFLVLLVRFYQGRIASRLSAWSVVFVVLFAAYGVATLHDMLAAHKARLAAVNQLRSAGVLRNQIRAGVEYDGWTQIEIEGHLNEPRIRIPANTYRLPPPSPLPPACRYWFDGWTPAIQGRYELSYSPSPCLPESEFPPLEYTTWLAPRHQRIYILKLPQ